MTISRKYLKYISYFLIAYLSFALIWWSILLVSENKKKRDLIEHIINEDSSAESAAYLQSIRYQSPEEVEANANRFRRMILSEGFVILLGLSVSFILIYRGYKNILDSERLKQNFLLSITHELKSPLASIQLAFQSLQRLMKGDAKIGQVINHGLTESSRLNQLINDLLMSTKVDSAYKPYLSAFSPSSILEDMMNEMAAKFPAVELTLKAEEVIEVVADKLAFEVCARNIIENAIKYGKESPINIENILENNLIKLSVADAGPGISDHEKKKIFERFYRIGSEEVRSTKGTGLGLYIVKKIVGWNKGKIDLIDNKPQGIKFVIQLPFKEAIH